MNNLKKDNGSRYEKKLLDEISTGGNFSLFVIYCLFIIYIAITVYSTTDLVLLMPASTVVLPIFETQIPLTDFYWLVSPLVVIFHFYLLHRKEGYEKRIKQSEEDGKKCPPNFFGIEPDPRMRGMPLIFFANVACFFLGPLCLFYIQWRFSNYQSLRVSSVHFICLLVVVAASLCNKEFKCSVSDDQGKMTFLFLKITTLILALVVGFVNFLTVEMLHSKPSTAMLLQWKMQIDTAKKQGDKDKFSIRIKEGTLWLIPKITFPSNSDATDTSFAKLKIFDLSHRRLMFADLSNNNMQQILFKETYLQGADMGRAQLQGADMSAAQLQGADMSAAQLQGADMKSTQLQGADMKAAQLQGATMNLVELQGADMRWAQLQGADMSAAQLQGADMKSTQLQGADMEEAQLQGADMLSAQFQGAYIKGAQFHGANTKNTAFNGSFCDPKISGSFFDQVNGRIGKLGLDRCKFATFGVLREYTADKIVEDLRKNTAIPESTIRRVQKRITHRVGKRAVVEVQQIGKLTLDATRAIIKNWEESVKNVPKFNGAVTNWLNTANDINPDLRKCLASK